MRPTLILCTIAALAPAALRAGELARTGVYEVVELTFAKARPDEVFSARFRHQDGSPEYRIHGYHDGAAVKVRFCPTKAGRWTVDGGADWVTATPSARHGFWEADPASPGRRWYRRSDGSHQYVFGNTHYGFLSRLDPDRKPGGGPVRDIRANAHFFKKVRFSPIGDLYPDPALGPFLDGEGRSTYDGAWSHRPNPRWFRERVDAAVAAAFEEDLVADLILAGVDTQTARGALSPARNEGDPEPYLRYMAARYGSYPNVWMCVINEFDIRTPKYSPTDIKRFGAILRKYLPYPTPVSVHASGRGLWNTELNAPPVWNDHVIVQRKIRTLAPAADTLQEAWKAGGADRPAVDDELSYQGAGDQHGEFDTLESHLGAFLGGGYGTTGYKSGFKTGQYFAGRFDPDEHSAAHGLKWLRDVIDRRIRFWRMAPGAAIFPGLDAAFRAMSWEGEEYVLGTDKAGGVRVELPPGQWQVALFDVAARREQAVAAGAGGTIMLEAPASRAALFHLRRLR